MSMQSQTQSQGIYGSQGILSSKMLEIGWK